MTDQGSGVATVLITGQLDSLLQPILDTTLTGEAFFNASVNPTLTMINIATEIAAFKQLVAITCTCQLGSGTFTLQVGLQQNGVSLIFLPADRHHRISSLRSTARSLSISQHRNESGEV